MKGTVNTMKKAYAELTESGKAKRLATYQKQREELSEKYGVEVNDCLANLVRPANIKENSNGSKTAVMRLAIYNAEEKKTDFVTGTMYIAPEKVGTKFESFIAGLAKGDLLSIRYVTNDHGNMNIWSCFKRQRPQKEEA
jgi:hypothetical protein